MNKLIKLFFGIFISLQIFSAVFATTGRYDNSLDTAIDPIRQHLNAQQPDDPEGGGKTFTNFLFQIIDDVIIPIAISIGIVLGIIGAYKLLFSSDEKQISTGLKMVLFGVVGIIIMVSAKYIGSVIFEDIFASGNLNAITGLELSKAIYTKIAYPFIKIALYLALAVIFVILLGKSISLITKSDGTSHKKALGIIGWCAVAILIIIGAKSIVEAIYGKQEEVFVNAQNLGEIGSGILANKNIPIIYNVINWALGIIGLVIFILLLVQGFKILINPSKFENFQKLGKSILYSLIGLFVIGLGYILTNALILN